MNRSVVTAMLPLLVLVVGACAENEPDTAVEALDQGGEQQVELVTGEPFEATGVVDDVLGPRGFLLFDTLVVTTRPVSVAEDDRVSVVGEVETARELERRFAGALNQEVLDALADKDVVVLASEVAVVNRDAR